jgi:hypothetical protein
MEEMRCMKLIETRPVKQAASYQAVTKVNAKVASGVNKSKGRANNRVVKAAHVIER